MHSTSVLHRASGLATIFFCTIAFACGGSSSSANGVTGPGNNPPPNGSTLNLVVSNDKYTPAHDSVGPGSKLTWNWDSCSGDGYGNNVCVSHSVKFDDGKSSSPVQNSGSFSRTFPDTGTFTYHCAIHGTAMSGVIVVR